MNDIHITHINKNHSYKEVWDLQEKLLQKNVERKKYNHRNTEHYLLLCEHTPVYTIGKNGNMAHLLLQQEALQAKNIELHRINRGGDITFHGPGQLVVYPILDLEKFQTDVGKYLRTLEQVVINTLSTYGLSGERSQNETGVWLEPTYPERARKICAIGVRLSRWVSMHGLALNVNTDLAYFHDIVPCGIRNKSVTSISEELQEDIIIETVKPTFLNYFLEAFNLNPICGKELF